MTSTNKADVYFDKIWMSHLLPDLKRSRHKFEMYSDEFLHSLFVYTALEFYKLDEKTRNRIMKAFDAELKPLESDYVLWRGITLKSWDDLDKESDILNLDTVKFKTFLSTSHEKETAMRFIKHESKIHIKIIFKIHAKAGTKGIDLEFFKGTELYKPYEQEVILDRNLKFQIIKKAKRKSKSHGDYRFVEMEQI